MPSITCGCGFVVIGNDEDINHSVYEEHQCPNARTHPLGYLFSVWTVLLILAVGLAVTEIIKAVTG